MRWPHPWINDSGVLGRVFCLLLLVSPKACLGHTLESWHAVWSPYRIVDDLGVERRLVKATIQFVEPSEAGSSLVLRDVEGRMSDTQPVPVGTKGLWSHGFWFPANAVAANRFLLELKQGERIVERRTVAIATGGETAVELPLRLDRMNGGLQHRLESRESSVVPDQVAGLESYLSGHDIIYRQPSPGWDEGLPLGNGDLGALVTGETGSEQAFYLDKTDIWLSTAEGKPLGRSYAGTLRVRYHETSPPRTFLQRLSLSRGEVTTRDGGFRSTARVHALRNRLEIEISAAEFEVSLERKPVPLWDNSASRLYGSWAAVSSPSDLEPIRAAVARAPHTQVQWGREAGQCWFIHDAPNLRYVMVIGIAGGDTDWRRDIDGCVARVKSGNRRTVRLRAAVATSRQSPDPLAAARQLLGAEEAEAHRQWWRRFWMRSWIELPDKLEENLWYLGLYQQAVCSRSDQAVSFFGLWHPLDLRPWYDGYVADAQVEMMWWESFATNHLELLYPSHHTFGRLAAEFARHTPGQGMVVPHLFTPEWAGGRRFFTGANPFKGSVAWYTMNFWRDYLYSADREFLTQVTYPLLRMVADYFSADLVKEKDGRYHCVKSGSPEQNGTARDNIYDWALLTWLFRASIRASEILEVDLQLRDKWKAILNNLFECPGDGKTVWETPVLAHPYRCHPVVFFGLYPTNVIAHDSPLLESLRRTMPEVIKLVGFRYEDRHAAIPGFDGGVEPNGFSSGILTVSAARLGDRELYRRFLYGLIVRFHLKQNGLRALLDTRQSSDIARASIVEAANTQTVAITETLLQSWDDHVHIFPCIEPRGRYRFGGLRAEGGFLISAEAQDGQFRGAQVKSLVGGPLRLAIHRAGTETLSVRDHATNAPVRFDWLKTDHGQRQLQLACRAGVTYDIVAGERVAFDVTLPSPPPRTEPRMISIAAVENQSRILLLYPEDLPFGEVVEDANLYLGRPVKYGPRRSAPPVEPLLAQARNPGWQDRQAAARLLSRVQPTPDVLAALDRLCADPVNVVAHTAAVTLVRFGTPEALAIADEAARKNSIPGLQREVQKAISRYRRRTEK